MSDLIGYVNAGYTVIAALPDGPRGWYVAAATLDGKFVTWSAYELDDNGLHFYSGHYFDALRRAGNDRLVFDRVTNGRNAMADLADRAGIARFPHMCTERCNPGNCEVAHAVEVHGESYPAGRVACVNRWPSS